MESEENKPRSGDTSMDSKGSGGSQKSMLELLTITDAAVKALNKSTHSTGSQGSNKSQKGNQSIQSNKSQGSGRSQKSDQSARSGQSGRYDTKPTSGTVGSQQMSDIAAGIEQQTDRLPSDRSDKSVRSRVSEVSVTSHRSVASNGSKPVSDRSCDSGLASKTVTSEKSKSRGATLVSPTDGTVHDRSSDESTTASDVLIRSTLEKSDSSLIVEAKNMDTGSNSGSGSGSSKCSKTSFGVENFNSSGPQKVKISRKHLHEIKPPFDDISPRSSASSDSKVPSALLKGPGVVINHKTGQEMEVVTSSNDSNGDKFMQRSFPRGADGSGKLKAEKGPKLEQKMNENNNMMQSTKVVPNQEKFKKLSQSSAASSSRSTDSREKNDTRGPSSDPIANPSIQLRSTPKYFVERHTPQKSQTKTDSNGLKDDLPERKNLLQDLEDSLEIVTAHAADSSGSSSQPEIVTVPERIVTISAQNSLSPASSVSDLGTNPGSKTSSPPAVSFHSASHKLRDDRGSIDSDDKKSLDESGSIPPALSRPYTDNVDTDDDLKKIATQQNAARFQLFSRQTTGQGLQQGAPVSGADAPDKQKDTDIHISDFKLTDKQKMAKESFARRQGGPVRRVVQARIVGQDKFSSGNEEKTQQQPTIGQTNDQVLTVAAAASAAVAATQPFIKAQQEMELKMAEVLARIAELQGGSGSQGNVGTGTRSGQDNDRVRQLEQQLADMTEKRIEHMERLSEQQQAMQAKLLSLSRDAPSHAQQYQPRSYSPDTSNRAYSKTTVARQQPHPKGDYSNLKHSALDLDHDETTSPLHTPAPRARAPRPTANTSDIEYRVGRSRSPKAKSPKGKARQVIKDKGDHGILHQILASVDSPVRDINRQSIPITVGALPVTASGRITSDTTCESPNVKKAKHLIDDLATIKHQVQGLVEDKENWKASQKETADISKQDANTTNISHTGPFPLDSYLSIPDHADVSPYKSVPDLSSSKLNAPVLPGFKDAESILRQVQQNRGYLESNFEAVLRARQEVEVYSMLEAVYNDSTDHEKARIKQMVDKSIQKLRREVEREVTDDLVISAVQKKQSTLVPGAVKMPEPAPVAKTAYSRPGMRGSRLTQPKVEPPLVSKKPVAKKPAPQKKEPFQHKFYRPPPKRKSVFEDEEAMTKIYGKASYQKGRTTVKDPYLHFQNTAKHKPSRQTVQAVDTTKGVPVGKEMMSSKTQTSTGGVQQYYFNPTTGRYIPIASVNNTAPIPGQLIQMAVPLGGPRMNAGVMRPDSSSTPSVGSNVPMVTSEGNVSMVSFGVESRSKSPVKPELGKQVLPAVDIDTDISDLSEIMEEPQIAAPAARTPERKPKKHVQIISPTSSTPNKPHYEVMQHEDETVVEDESMVSGTGLELPGYQPEEVPEQPNYGPAFPPKMPSNDRQITSDLIAENIKQRDLLQNKATEWIEQELMARIITEVYPLKDKNEPPGDISHVVSEASEDSMAEEKEKSMFVMDTIGHRGMQLFIDAGHPVDNTLVNKLIEEVMLEKIRTMIGQRPDAEDTRQPIRSEEPQWEEPVSEPTETPPIQRSMVRTPELTPRASPRGSPTRRDSPAYTPIASPPATSRPVPEEVFEPVAPTPVVQPVMLPPEPESEPESSASYDIQEELGRLADKLRPNVNASASLHSRHDVTTPPESPKPEPQQPMIPAVPLTPPQLSPRQQLIEEPILTTQSVAPAGTSNSAIQSRISKSESPKSATSPQVTDLAEEELAEDQPKALVFTVAETQTSPRRSPEPRPKSRSPSPDKTRSRTPSESSYTESSSISESFNECVSEGQWLINKSDGEVADFPIDEVAVRERMLRMNSKRVDISSASTWKDTEDVDLEMTDVSRSEGEFLYKTEFPPEKDPVLDMLARLQSAQPKYGMYQMSNRQVSDVLNTTGKSEGEVMRVSSAGHPMQQQQQWQQQQQQQQQQYIPEKDYNYNSPKRSKSPTSRSPGKKGGSPRKGDPSQYRSKSPTNYRAPSPTRVSFEGDLNDQPRSVSPTRSILKRSSSFENQNQPVRRPEFDAPVRDSGRSHTPTGRLTPGGRQPKGMMSAGGRTASPVKSSMRRPPQVIKSSTMPDTRGSGGRIVNVRTSSEDYRDSLDNSGMGYYGSDVGARNMTPDQMNIDALIQSGYLSQSFSQSENGNYSAQSSMKSSGNVRQSRTSVQSGRSLGYSYGTEGSISMSELQRLADNGTGKLQMSLTIPGTDQDESDLSEIDITDAGNTR